ncbi:MAG TPA: PadR family transcriptional regulator, partial [Vicinamibacterales bacterium]|nr:PadR family transcriptional regulator [Vicinamibacterales bacterium]
VPPKPSRRRRKPDGVGLHALCFYTYCGIGRSTRCEVPDKSDLPQGTLDLLILQVVAAGPIHGYAIAQRLQLISRDVVQVPQGSLYPALHRLENRGLLTADWKTSDTGRDSKFYRLTRKGRKQLKEEAASWLRLTEAIALILKAAGGSL